MATWVVHLRVCDRLIDKIKGLSVREFIIGNVAPDCGYGEKDSAGGDFIPPATVTHWTKSGKKSEIDAEGFYKAYVNDKPLDEDVSFYLGYYVHLITDIVWSERMYLPTKEKYAEEYAKNSHFLKIIKNDWYDLDHKYLRDNQDFRAFKIFSKVYNVKDYLPYYEKGQLTRQVGFIRGFYTSFKYKDKLDREYKYLTEEKMNKFIGDMARIASADLKKRGYIGQED